MGSPILLIDSVLSRFVNFISVNGRPFLFVFFRISREFYVFVYANVCYQVEVC